jgi:site-specific recombinase XerD
MISTLKYYQGKIVVYFKNSDCTIRYKILKIDQNKLLKNLYVKQTIANSGTTNQLIKDTYEKVDEIITKAVKDRKSFLLSKKYIDNELLKHKDKIDVTDLTHLLPLYEEFLLKKTKDFLVMQGYPEVEKANSLEEIKKNIDVRDKSRSIKDYISTKNLLKDFELFSKKSLTVSDLDVFFVANLHSFASSERDDKNNYKTRKQADNTFKKRLSCVMEFIKFLNKELKYEIDIKDFSYSVKKPTTNIVALDNKELQAIQKLKFTNPVYEKTRDILIFLCMTGLRYSDFITFDKDRDLSINDGDYYIIKDAIKTRNRFEVPINKTAQEIAEKYNFDFRPHLTNQAYNRMIKSILQDNELFKDEITLYYYHRGKESKVNEAKNENISSHTGRRTFITNCVKNNIPLHSIMAMTGHKKIDTLLIYFEKWGMKSNKYVKQLEL